LLNFLKQRRQMKPVSSLTNRAADVELLRRCKRAITDVAENADVVLYGSRARGDAGEGSDYDILVIVDGPVDMALEEKMVDNVYPLELESGQILTLIVYNKQQWDSALYRAMPFRKSVEQEGVVL